MCNQLRFSECRGEKSISWFTLVQVPRLTAFLRVAVVADEDFLALRPEQRGPVDGVVEAQAAVVEDVDVACADLIKRLELQGGDPTLLQDQQRYTASTAGDRTQRRRVRIHIREKFGGRMITGTWDHMGEAAFVKEHGH